MSTPERCRATITVSKMIPDPEAKKVPTVEWVTRPCAKKAKRDGLCMQHWNIRARGAK